VKAESAVEFERASELLKTGAHFLGIDLVPDQLQKFVHYCEILCQANAQFNLTALRTPEDITLGLILDSLTMISVIESIEERAHFTQEIAVVDLGSGAGIPGIPLKIMRPRWKIALIEATRKKAAFIEGAARELVLEEVTVLARRAEEVGRMSEWRDRAELCLARAVAPLAALVELSAPLVRQGGWMIFPKGKGAYEELVGAEAALRALRAELDQVVPIPAELGLGEQRVVVCLRKTGPTPSSYPRRSGLARSSPIGRPPK
jgi:16S rRNA (guanine527-N7)-methyltransferase